MIKKLINRFSWLLVIIGYSLINLIFNYRVYWHEIITDLSKTGAVWGEVHVYEWLTDKFYRTIISGHNPFSLVQGLLYPFSIHLGLTDAGNGFFFLILRLFFSMHQSMAIIATSSLLFANIGMYLLLRLLRIDKLTSFFVGLAYGYMTFLMPRGGHLNYWCIYLFPWFYYCAINLLRSNKISIKIFSSIGVSLFFVLTLWINFYYFIMLLISIFCLVTYYFIFKTKLIIDKLKKIWKYSFLIILLITIFLIPWAIGLYQVFKFDEVPKTTGWGGAIEFASDLFNYFIPSGYGYYVSKFPFLYKPFLFFLQLFRSEARSIFENFTYPGIIILFDYFALIFLYKKFDKSTKENIRPFLFTSIIFFILTLGPFLHVFGHWTLTVDEGIKIVIPLPYIILHYIPFLNNIRVPGRLIVGFIFFAYIVCAYIINYFIKNKSTRFKQVFFIIFFLIFVVDQRVTNSIFPPTMNHPYKIFNYIKADSKRASVLEIPFTVRDGFTYFGDNDAVWMTFGGSIHNKYIVGGYTGRITNYKKDYYIQNPFFGYLGRAIDKDVKINPVVDQKDLINWVNLDTEKSKKTIEFLDLKYIILDDNKSYAATLSAQFNKLGFYKKMIDKSYVLWEKIPDNKEFRSISLEDPNDNIFLGMGWYNPERNLRWTREKSSIMFKIIKPRKMTLNFTAASFYKDQYATIYLNKQKVSKVNISIEMKKYSIPIDFKFEPGINTVYFMFDKYFLPSKVVPGNLDERKLSGKFNKIWLTDQ